MKLGPSLWALALVTTLALPAAAQVDPESEADRCFGCADPISLVQCVAGVEEYRRFDDSNRAELERLIRASGVHRQDAEGNTALSLAAGYGLEAIATQLLRHGAHLEHRNRAGETPLLLATQGLPTVDNQRIGTVKLLLKRGARVRTADRQGRTPLMYAATATPDFKLAMLKLLVAYGASVTAVDANGENALFYLVRSYDSAMQGEAGIWRHYRESALFLISRKLDTRHRNRKGQTALDVARQVGFAEMAALLDPRQGP